MSPNFFAYWGKASPAQEGADRFHLLALHSLDVAACGHHLLQLPQFSLAPLAADLGWPLPTVERLAVFFLALHDLGKFARAFQGLVPGLSSALVSADPRKRYELRHDTLGWLLWTQALASDFPQQALPFSDDAFWSVWVKAVVGHHGKPPLESEAGGLLALEWRRFFLQEDLRAAQAFVQAVLPLLLPADLSALLRDEFTDPQERTLRRHSWRLAGVAVLADWLGSNQAHFPYVSAAPNLHSYWSEQALPQAEQAVQQAGLQVQAVRHWAAQPLALFSYLNPPTPLQRHAAELHLQPGPQMFLLEDVTGAGKTEAALILTQRLMEAGLAQGLYFALPSMATANQMYRRVGEVYQRLYAATARPSLILAHGARQLMADFRQSLLQEVEQARDQAYGAAEGTASVQCNQWLADHRKKALLADVGVGTLDQCLLAVLPARHQSLRLLGLSAKVLLVDEVHAYDPYMLTLLKRLLWAHARQGGSVILLSATLPASTRGELMNAYRAGLGLPAEDWPADARYPLVTQVGRSCSVAAVATRPQLVRRVQVAFVHDEAQAVALLVQAARQGRCVAWIRNTVGDARRAYQALCAAAPELSVHLFHSRFAMGDRLDIEDRVLSIFGKAAEASSRQGQVLIGTQVLEQSLDFDVDVMVTDLAPIDLVIQRAGRLQRHAREADGRLATDGQEHRPAPVLHLLAPEDLAEPEADWYAALFPQARYVYPDVGQLWLGARALRAAGAIVSPGQVGEAGAVRSLVEAVYGAEDVAIPSALQRASREQQGKELAHQSQAQFNALQFDKGYCTDSSAQWDEDTRLPTRLGDETLTVYLAVMGEAGDPTELQPLRAHEDHAWESSALRLRATGLQALAPEWLQRFEAGLAALRSQSRLLEGDATVLPLAPGADGVLEGWVLDAQGRRKLLRYDPVLGLCA